MDQSKCDHTCIAKANGDDANAAADDDDADDEVNDEEDDAKKGEEVDVDQQNVATRMDIAMQNFCSQLFAWTSTTVTKLSIQIIINLVMMFMSMAVRLSGI